MIEKLQRLKLLEQKIALQKGLPHLYGWKWYPWARQFFETRNKMAFLSAANQISKSSTQIRKMVHWATATDIWPELWRSQPRQFWMLYPNRDVCHIEFEKKWRPEFLPRGEYQNHPQYGWKAEYAYKRIWAIHFNSGVSVYFKTYSQDVKDLQSGTVDYIGLDEEAPADIMSELFMRLAAREGYLSAVFTPTTGQEYWREVIEVRGKGERFPDAFKLQVSMYDCVQYEDGTPGAFDEPKITRAINMCKSPQDVECRIRGRFVLSEGLKYPGFHRERNRMKGHPLPKEWLYFCGADPGSGGDNHPAAVCVVGVNPEFTAGRVFRGWRGDGVETTAGDVVKKAEELTKDLPNVRIFYDWACRDFLLIAQNAGLCVEPAEKSHAVGEQMLNVLFKNKMLMIYDYEELDPLVNELASLLASTNKRRAKDDFIDAVRYAISQVPWNWNAIRDDFVMETPDRFKRSPKKTDRDIRKEFWDGPEEDGLLTVEREIEEWNELFAVDDG
jgi:phage terminase large subunit-like protein